MIKNLFDFLAQNKDVVAILLTIGGGMFGVWKFFIERWWKNKVRVDVKVFDVISDANALLPKLYATENDDSPLADHNIKYQPRDPQRDMQAELKAALNRSRYLLVTAPTGVGKTREAGMLAQTMIHEGWRVLRIRSGWLDTPKTLPEELNGNRSRVLIFLDDLNGLFSAGERTQSPRMEDEKALALSQLSFHDRLAQMLDFFEGACTESEIRVIATARSEAEQWKLLEFNAKDKLWKRFERVEIPAPVDSAIVRMLEAATQQADESEFAAIAHKSDGTYRNILLNLRRWRAQNKTISKDDFVDTLDGSWRDIYERALKKQPAVKYVYDAIDVLRQAGIELFPFLVEPTAVKVWGGNWFQNILNKKKIQDAIRYLTVETKILRITDSVLSPSDGQIEAKKYSVPFESLTHFLTNLMLGKKINSALRDFAFNYYEQGKIEKSHHLYKQIVKSDSSDATSRNMLGIVLSDMKQYTEAETSYRKAIELNPLDANTHYNLGILLENMKRYAEAEDSYLKAIELDSALTETYENLGVLLSNQKRDEEAEAYYRKSIEIDPSRANAYFRLGSFLNDLQRYDEAEIVYRKVIELNPSEAKTYNNLGSFLNDLQRYDEAEAAYRKAIELNPSYAGAYYNLGILLKNQKRHEEAVTSYRKSIELNPSYASAYNNLGLVLRDLKWYEEAEVCYRKSIELNPLHVNAYKNLGLLLHEKLKRYDEAESSYRKVIKINPLDTTAYSNLGYLLQNLKRYDEAEAAYRKAIEINPSYTRAYNNLVRLLKFNLKDRLEETLPLLEKIIEINAEDFDAYLASVSVSKQLGKEVSRAYIEKARQYMPEDDFYNRACLESVCDNFDLAFEYLGKAAQAEGFNSQWAWDDPDLQWLRGDARFAEIVGKREMQNAE